MAHRLDFSFCQKSAHRNKNHDHIYRRLRVKPKRMTLIIGFKCKDGVALVSDTKVMDVESGEEFYQSKILTPLLDTPLMVGAAGFTNLFREFNRKMPEVVTESVNKIRVLNVAELRKTGLSREEAINKVITYELKTVQSQQEIDESDPSNESKTPPIDLPLTYTYSAEKFIDDCKALIKKITSNFEEDSNPIDVLIGLSRQNSQQPELHGIDSKGSEDEIDEFTAIGSGSPYVKTFFERIYDYDKSIFELITQAFRTIIFSNIIAKENTVGYTLEYPPEAVVILNDGRCGRMFFKNEKNIIEKLESEMNEYENLIDKKIPYLEWDQTRTS